MSQIVFGQKSKKAAIVTRSLICEKVTTDIFKATKYVYYLCKIHLFEIWHVINQWTCLQLFSRKWYYGQLVHWYPIFCSQFQIFFSWIKLNFDSQHGKKYCFTLILTLLLTTDQWILLVNCKSSATQIWETYIPQRSRKTFLKNMFSRCTFSPVGKIKILYSNQILFCLSG